MVPDLWLCRVFVSDVRCLLTSFVWKCCGCLGCVVVCVYQKVISDRVGVYRVGFFLVYKISPFFCCCVYFLSFFRKALFQVGPFIILVAHRWISVCYVVFAGQHLVLCSAVVGGCGLVVQQ